MEVVEVITLTREALWVAIRLSVPIMMIGLVVGVTIALFQALTQIQEMTLAFVPKILAILLAVFAFLPFFASIMIPYMQGLTNIIRSFGGN